MNVNIVMTERQAKAAFEHIRFHLYIPITENMGIALCKKKAYLAKTPVHLAFSILSMAKLLLLKFWYSSLYPTMQRHDLLPIHTYTDSK